MANHCYSEIGGNHTINYWYAIGTFMGMKKWFFVAVNVLLGSFVVLSVSLQRIAGTHRYHEILTRYIPGILLSFTAFTFLLLIFSSASKRH